MAHTFIRRDSEEHFHKHGSWRKHQNFYSVPHVLVVDDDVESIQPLLIVLRNFGFDVTVAFDGLEGLNKIAKENFELVFLDISMPGLNGVEVMERIQETRLTPKTRFSTKLPIITYSSRRISELKMPMEQGFIHEGHWQKPVSIPDLTTLTGLIVNQMRLHLPNISSEPTDDNEGGSI